MQTFGHVDVLINNAGKGTAYPATCETPDQFGTVIDVNLNGSYWMAQACGRIMQPGSSIIDIAGVLGITTAGLPQAAYTRARPGLSASLEIWPSNGVPAREFASMRWRRGSSGPK
jgi:NAD(P)-dependent dehydrogenase (short-subunit alcohol dehydrogenase family)